jgi:regulatory protein
LTLSASVQDSETRLQHALDLGFRYLGHRDRTVLEMRRHLESKRVEPETIDAALAELARLGNLDDARFARLFAEDRRTLDGWGPERIERRLAQMGVDPELIAAVTARDPEDELNAALDVLRRRLAAPPEDDRGRERALGLLVRRGYDLDTAYAAVRRFSAAA